MRHSGSHTASDAVGKIKAYWEFHIAPWLAALLRVITFDESRTQNAMEIIEHALVVTPQLITCNARTTGGFEPTDGSHWMHEKAMYLRPLLIRLWFNLLHERHRETRNWTLSLSYYGNGLYNRFMRRFSDPSQMLPYLDDSLTEHRAGLILIGHLNELRRTVRTLQTGGFLELGKFLALLNGAGIAPHSPFHLRSIARYMAPALVKLFGVLFFKWRDLPPLQSPTFDWVYHATGSAIGHLVEAADLGRVWVEEALDAGLIEAILKTNPIYCVYEEVVRSGMERRHTIDHLLGNLFLSILRYLMWPSATRRVLRWSKKVQKSSSENTAHAKSQEGRMDFWAY